MSGVLPVVAGDLVWVRFGGFGHQAAYVVEADGFFAWIHKYRRNSASWTKRIKVRRSVLLSHVAPEENETLVLAAAHEFKTTP